MENRIIKDELIIDVAVLCEEITEVRQTTNDHITNLDNIEITKELFQNIFYPYSENFGIDKNFINQNEYLKSIISFLPNYRTVNGNNFYLLEQILTNLENDLNVSRNCFTIESRVELTNQITEINTLSDINTNTPLSSLTWSNILNIVNNYKLIKNKNKNTNINPTCTVSVIFKTPTNNVENTIIRFNYKIIDI